MKNFFGRAFLPIIIIYFLVVIIGNLLFHQSISSISSVSSGVISFLLVSQLSFVALLTIVPLIIGGFAQHISNRKSILAGFVFNLSAAILLSLGLFFWASSSGESGGYFLLGFLFVYSWFVLGGLILYSLLQKTPQKVLYTVFVALAVVVVILLVRQVQTIKTTQLQGGDLPQIYTNLDVNQDIDRSGEYFDQKVSYCKTFSTDDSKRTCAYKLYDDLLLESFKPNINISTLISQSNLDFLCKYKSGNQNPVLCN